MFSVKMIQLIKSHAEVLSEQLMHRLERSRQCPGLLRKVPAYKSQECAYEMYRNLSDWLITLTKNQSDIEEEYVSIGMQRARQGVPFSELLFAFSATKECLWGHLEENAVFEDPVELIGDLNLLHSIGRFFDQVAHAAALGYEEAHRKDIRESVAVHPTKMSAARAS